jgi:hypothetical protein
MKLLYSTLILLTFFILGCTSSIRDGYPHAFIKKKPMNKVIPHVAIWMMNKGYILDSDSLTNEKSLPADWGEYPFSIRGTMTKLFLYKNNLELNFYPKTDSIEITFTYDARDPKTMDLGSRLRTYNQKEGLQNLLDTLAKEINASY